MNRRCGIGRVLLLLMHCSLFLRPLYAEELVERVHAFMNEAVERNLLPAVSVVIADRNGILLADGYGSGRAPSVDQNTRFPIASLSKSITALAVLQLVDEGRIALQEPASTYLEGVALQYPDGEHVTVDDLLTMRSGLSEHGGGASRLFSITDLSEYVSRVGELSFYAEPGEEFHYFNPNYAVLARIIEIVTDVPFERYLDENIFRPLGMDRTVAIAHTSDLYESTPDTVQGHRTAFVWPIESAESPRFIDGSGGIVSTAADMGRFLTMQLSGGVAGDSRIVSQELFERSHQGIGAGRERYAYGWFDRTEYEPATVEHRGSLSTYASTMVLLPEQGYGFALLLNRQHFLDGATTMPQLEAGLTKILTGEAEASSHSVSRRIAGWLVLLFAVFGTAYEIRGVFKLRTWKRTHETRGTVRAIISVLSDLTSPAVLVLLPSIIALFLGRQPDHVTLFASMPDIMGFLILSACIATGRAMVKTFFLIRAVRPGAFSTSG